MNLLGKTKWAFSLLAPPAKKKFILLCSSQMSLPVLDLISVAALAKVLSFANSHKLQSFNPLEIHWLPHYFQSFFSSISSLILSSLVLISVLVVAKGILSTFLLRNTFRFLAAESAAESTKIARDFFDADLDLVQKRASQETLDALNSGIDFAFIGILGSFSSLVAEVALILFLAIYLFYTNLIIAAVAVIYFLTTGYIIHTSIAKESEALGKENTSLRNQTSRIVQETIISFREFHVFNLIPARIRMFSKLRIESATLNQRMFLVNNLPKYAYESAFFVGACLVTAFATVLSGGTKAAPLLVTFIFAGSRIMPSMLRVQTAVNTLKSSYGASHYFRRLADDVFENLHGRKSKQLEAPVSISQVSIYAFECVEVKFRYFPTSNFSLEIPDLKISQGENVGIVGISGSGKSTFADLLLGALTPQEGTVSIFGKSPKSAIVDTPGLIGYVPQSTTLLDSSIAENVAFGVKRSDIDFDRLSSVLQAVDLFEFVLRLPDNVNHLVGERGAKLSGGQKQRLALARSLYLKPKILVLDEATSSLDSETEDTISHALEKIDTTITKIVIAHRLSTIRSFKRILYFDNGRIVGDSDFETLRLAFPSFDSQVRKSKL
jgi:ABC-type multidrug transport system fused ATPase/permease subunit